MGFFSSIKKILGGNAKEQAEAITQKSKANDAESAVSGAEITPAESVTPTEPVVTVDVVEDKSIESSDVVEESAQLEVREVEAEVIPKEISVEKDIEVTEVEVTGDEIQVVPEQPSVSSSVQPAISIDGFSEEDKAALALALRAVEPRLSAWLSVVLQDIETPSSLLWQRLSYLLISLDAKAEEAESFVQDFQGWLKRMEYEYVEEFRSELQYRLTLALELEDEEDERNRLFVKLSTGLSRTREQFTRKLDALFASHGQLDAAFWEELEELFIMADIGFESSMQLIERLKDGVRKKSLSQTHEIRQLLQDEVQSIFQTPKRISAHNPPEVIMMVGVNGVGKTTTIAKLAHRDRMQGKKVLIAAADTFRAAATEQLGVWAKRVGADFHGKQAGADPAAVAFEAMDLALREKYDVLYIDTAGRLQTKLNLMEELKKIRNVVSKKHNGAPHRVVMVIDATTGQNALSQTKLFNDVTQLNEIILSKLDGTAKGGVAISVALQFNIPITYVGLGEKLEDLRPFNGKDFASALLGEEK